jgi:hypothetical protein
VKWKDSQPSGSLFTYIYVDKHIGRDTDGDSNPHSSINTATATNTEYRQWGKEKNVKALFRKKLTTEEEEEEG